MKKVSLPIVIEKDEDGYFAYCPSLQGCYTQGNSYEEVLRNIEDAVKLHIENRIKSREPLPEPKRVSLTSIEVTV